MAFMALSAAAAVFAVFASFFGSTSHFHHDACTNVGLYLPSQIVGQDLAIRQLEDAICEHLSQQHPAKPLVLSAHGPPGVGKTLTHTLLARALYNKHPERALECPGKHCLGYKVLYGMNFVQKETDQQLQHIRDAIIAHVRDNPEPLLIVEEYDKLDCQTRGFFRQLLQHTELANTSFNRGIVMFESNLGMGELQEMLSVRDRSQVRPEDAERRLKSLVHDTWSLGKCEAFEDTLKMTSLVDFYLPYFPLGRPEVQQLFRKQLQGKAAELLRSKGLELVWCEEVEEYLVEMVEFDGDFPLEGAKPVDRVMTRHLGRLLRELHARADMGRLEGAQQWQYRLLVNGKGLVLQEAAAAAAR